MATRKPVKRDKNGKKVTLLQSLKGSDMSRRALFLTLMTAFLVGYGVFSAFATLASPAGGAGSTATASTVDYNSQTASAGAGSGSSGGASGCCGGGSGSGSSGSSSAQSSGGGGCCGGGGGPEVKGAATVNGDVQEITVQVNGNYNPNVIEVKKGVPLKITFERHSNSGCDSQISIPDINVFQNLPTDGTVTFTIPVPNEAGKTITFTCGMNMLKGTIKVID